MMSVDSPFPSSSALYAAAAFARSTDEEIEPKVDKNLLSPDLNNIKNSLAHP
jgi:hypothetical protein